MVVGAQCRKPEDVLVAQRTRIGTHVVARPLAACLAVLLLSAGCAASAKLAPTLTSTLAPAANATVSPAPTLAQPSRAPVPTLPPPAHRAQTIHVLEEPLAFHTVAAGGCTSTAGCKGDQLIGSSRMLDADTHVDVGSFLVKCVLLDPAKNRYHCPANAITLTGRGQIVFDETFNLGGPWDPVPWPIISGTGEFLGATGSVTSPKDSTWSYGDFVITITG
jgi:hypothetical protein